ncbi:glycosyltransferase [Parabacteroides pacaensis]|uniref:glycosyltransferase n=1 Tax=Parabacteroides pacaensis TaxID=2086575 RepID=UPI000D0F3E06|nr:glycosyltransferase [Parabacteroides pacaensis]
MMLILSVLEIILFILFAINVLYLLFFSVLSCKSVKSYKSLSVQPKKIAILIPAYKEDGVIMECVESCLNQEYPKDKYDIVVISDRMTDETNRLLSTLPIRLIEVFFKNSTKSKALNYAMGQLGEYDIALVLDADNTIAPDFLTKIDLVFHTPSVEIVQAHRMAKNTNTHMALLDAVSEEINNSIFRKGHVNAGLSAALIGSGMAFKYPLFKQVMLTIDAVGGFDRALELTLLYEKKKVDYLPDADVLDEKVQYREAFSNQRRRWMSAQVHYLNRFLTHLPAALKDKNWDFCDKLFQQVSIPRLILVGLLLILAISFSFVNWSIAVKWWILVVLLIFSLLLAIPRSLYKWDLLFALWELPYSFCLMFLNLFRLKGANKKFIHTSHGVKK